jgi:hypothetical protein
LNPDFWAVDDTSTDVDEALTVALDASDEPLTSS